LKKGLIKKERRRSHENYVIAATEKKNQKSLEKIVKLCQGN